MYGVNFDYKHSYDDWNLILTERKIGLPEPNRYSIDVPGKDGKLDLTEYITPNITYKNRTINFTFRYRGSVSQWESLLHSIVGYLHGRKLKVWEDVDDSWYWEGFWTVDQLASTKSTGTIVIKGDVYPYKYKTNNTVKSITGNGTINCTNDRMPVSPWVVTTADTTLDFNDVSVNLHAGTYLMTDFVFEEGDNEVTVTSTGTTTIQYRQGEL